jgi:beta-phosphoglucomutase-like phosphatase (HAD superfamily)
MAEEPQLETDRLIGQYAELVKEFGENAEEAKTFLDEHRDCVPLVGIAPFINSLRQQIESCSHSSTG